MSFFPSRWFARTARGPRARANRARYARSRAVVLWGLVCFGLCQAGLLVLMEHREEVLRDPEYGIRLAHLRAHLAEDPGRPLVLLIGSSRSEAGFRPESLEGFRTRAGERPLFFNFARGGSGPLMDRVMLRRLLANGIRPRWLLVEVLPSYLHKDANYAEENWINLNYLGWGDVHLLARYFSRPRHEYYLWARSRAAAWFTNRNAILSRLVPQWLPWDYRTDDLRRIGGLGWKPWFCESTTPEEHWRVVQAAHWQFGPTFADFHVSPDQDRALRDLLATCKREHIPVGIVLSPEGSEFRGWYTPMMQARLDQYLAQLQADFGVAVINARTWVPDEYFYDSHHLFPRGAALYTELLGQRALHSFLENSSPPPVQLSMK